VLKPKKNSVDTAVNKSSEDLPNNTQEEQKFPTATYYTNETEYWGEQRIIQIEQSELQKLHEDLDRLRNQVKRESELRMIAEENLQLCQKELKKEHDSSTMLRKKVIGLETKLYTSEPTSTLPTIPNNYQM